MSDYETFDTDIDEVQISDVRQVAYRQAVAATGEEQVEQALNQAIKIAAREAVESTLSDLFDQIRQQRQN